MSRCNCNQGRLPCSGSCQTSVPDDGGRILAVMGFLFFVAVVAALIGVIVK